MLRGLKTITKSFTDKNRMMKRCLIVCVSIAFIALSCSPKYGCPTNGKNVGAEKLLSGYDRRYPNGKPPQ